MSQESLSRVAFSEKVDVVVSCLASRTGGRGGAAGGPADVCATSPALQNGSGWMCGSTWAAYAVVNAQRTCLWLGYLAAFASALARLCCTPHA